MTSTINYVNPNATDEQLTSLATAFNDLTTNTVTDITRIDRNSLTASSKSTRNIRLENNGHQVVTSLAYSSLQTDPAEANTINLIADGGATPAELIVSRNLTGNGFLMVDWYDNGDGVIGIALTKGGNDTSAGTITFTLPETEIYKAASVTLTIT